MSDQWYESQLPLGFRVLEDLTGISKSSLRAIAGASARPQRPNPGSVAKLVDVINKIENRRVVWRKLAVGYDIIYLDAPVPRPVRQKISPFNVFGIFDICATCGGSKWLLAKMAGKEHVMCYSCVPPNQWPALGATSLPINLIGRHMEAEACRIKRFSTSAIPTSA